MAPSLLIDLAVPVEGAPPPDERVHTGLLPAGDYVTLLFRGHYDGLVAANAAVQQWGERRGVRWAMAAISWPRSSISVEDVTRSCSVVMATRWCR